MSVIKYTIPYLKNTVKGFQSENKGKMVIITCPKCQTFGCKVLPFSYKLYCTACGGNIGNIYKILEDLHGWSQEEVFKQVTETLNLDITPPQVTTTILDYYESQDFDLVPLAVGQKIPFEGDWLNKEHKAKEEWIIWLDEGFNVGAKTGKRSGITVIDIDKLPIPEELTELLKEVDTLTLKTNKGLHLFFKYVAELPNSSIKEKDDSGEIKLAIDIQNDGAQVVVPPSIIEGKKRAIKCKPIQEMPFTLQEFFLEKTKNKKGKHEVNPIDVAPISDTDLEIGLFNAVEDGNRHNMFMHLGGILRKDSSMRETKRVLGVFNRYFCNPPLDGYEFSRITDSLDKYINFDHKEIAERVLEYISIVKEVTAKSIQEVIQEKKILIDKAVAYLVKEGLIVKGYRGVYHAVQKANWKTNISDITTNKVNFRVPLFDDVMYFNWGDMLLLGAKTKDGKTTIAINIIKELVDQGLKPYYIYSENGSRFKKTSLFLGLKDDEFHYDFQVDPTKIKLEPNAITIIDWLMIKDKSQTDVVMQHFIEQLDKTNGFLIMFQQLKEYGDQVNGWFAPNMAKQFPSLAARYIYDEKDGKATGESGSWHVDAMREPKLQSKKQKIPCRYDWKTKEFKVVKDGGSFEGETQESES